MLHRKLPFVLVPALAALLMASCAEQQPTINRIPPNILKKSYLVGPNLQDPSDDPEFYTQSTLVDVGSGSGMEGPLMTMGHADKLARIKFEIAEDQLIARLTYEYIEGTDGRGIGRTSITGVPVAAWRIERQSDIEYSYNPTTGERNNVLTENYDRPWYEREYIVVDWGRNLFRSSYEFDTLTSIGMMDAVQYEPLAFDVTNLKSEWAPRFEVANKGGKNERLDYFDVTQKAFATPALADYRHWGLGMFPVCVLNGWMEEGGMQQCNPVELTFRMSFRRVVDQDYEAADWDGLRFQAFGGFTRSERRYYTREQGFRDTTHFRFLERYNIWERNHYYDKPETMEGSVACFIDSDSMEAANRDERPQTKVGSKTLKGDGTADECGAVSEKPGIGSGSQCDIFTRKCTLPYRARTVKPIVWYMSDGSDFNYFESTDWSAHEWDIAIRHAVSTARYAECIREVEKGQSNMTADKCAADFMPLKGQSEDQQMAIRLATEVDACRNGRAYDNAADQGTDKNKYGQFNCAPLADRLGKDWKASPEAIALAKADEAVVLCHSPVEAGDHPLCTPNNEPRLPSDLTAAQCSNALHTEDWATLARCRCVDGKSLGQDCVKPIMTAKPGDIRYHLVNMIRNPMTGATWGIMQDASDPLTGEKVSASLNIFTAVTENIIRDLVDRARYIKGELSTEDMTEGTYIKDFVNAAKAMPLRAGQPMAKEEIAQRIASVIGADGVSDQAIHLRAGGSSGTRLDSEIEMLGAQSNAKAMSLARELVDRKFNDSHNTAIDKSARAFAKEQRNFFKNLYFGSEYATSRSMADHARREGMIGTVFEADMMSPAMLQIAGNYTGAAATGVAAMLSSGFQLANPAVIIDIQALHQDMLAESGRCVMNEAPMPIAIANIADTLERKFGAFNVNDSHSVKQARADKMAKFLGQRVNYNVLAHEAGHSFGLRHNFVSSSDAYNFRPQYWQLRTRNGAATAKCTDVKLTDAEAEACVGPRYFDPMTAKESENLINMFMQSTLMDYAGDMVQDFIGLGTYDFGATRMFYGDVAAVYKNDAFKRTGIAGETATDHLDNFGGILGFTYDYDGEGIHYSQLQSKLNLITDCGPVAGLSEPTAAKLRKLFQPATWPSDGSFGTWDPLFDGGFVSIDGLAADNYTSCKTQPIDYVKWGALKNSDLTGERHGPDYDYLDRVRVPYTFGTDHWADHGNLAVYRHDNGADPYELFDFMIMNQEVNHIFQNYRRFNPQFDPFRSAAGTLRRYNAKMRDAAKGLGAYINMTREAAIQHGINGQDFYRYFMNDLFVDNMLASTMAFDHFTRQLARPESGPHYFRSRFTKVPDPVLRSSVDVPLDGAYGTTSRTTAVTIPNGVYPGERFRQIAIGGRPIENRLMRKDCGDYCTRYVMNSGSYYEKAFTGFLLTESRDNYISSTRGNFVDTRDRATGMADLFPDGYRRWLANNLTGDDFIKGPRLALDANGKPDIDADGYPKGGIMWTSWTPVSGPKVCTESTKNLASLDANGAYTCNEYDYTKTVAIDPQVGWEQWRWLLNFTMIHLPSNQQDWWMNQLKLWKVGEDPDPQLPTRIEYHSPTGATYIARRYGTEEIFGQTVEKGIGARVLEWANYLLSNAYETETVSGQPWVTPKLNSDGLPVVMFDPDMTPIQIDANGRYIQNPTPKADCNADTNVGCKCEDNRWCMQLERYEPLMNYMHYLLEKFGWRGPYWK